jgi:hypothetical protein
MFHLMLYETKQVLLVHTARMVNVGVDLAKVVKIAERARCA